MKIRSFCSLRKQLARISRLAGIAALAVSSAGLSAHAGSVIPDWMRAAAQEPPAIYPPDTTAVVLLDDRETTVKDSGEIENRYRRVFRVLRPEARDELGRLAVFYNDETRIEVMHGWAIAKNGQEYEAKEKDALEHGAFSEALYADVKVKLLTLPAVNTGSVIGYEYVQRQRPFLQIDQWDFQELVPVKHSKFTLSLPSGWEFDSYWAHYPEIKPQALGNETVWQLENIPAIETEPDMPEWEAVAGRLEVKYFPRDPGQRLKASGSWRDMGLWYTNLTASSRDVTPEIKQKVAELTAGQTTTLGKINALAAFVQRQVRYVAIEIGIGGYQPHPAAQVFANSYGDCKDKATLLSAMLREIGVESYYVLAQTERGIVLPQFAFNYFNHAILAIRLPDDVAQPDLHAVMQHPTLGRLLFFDPTNEYTPLGALPPYLQESYGLLVAPDGGELVRMPLAAPNWNRLERSAKLALSPSGTLTGDVEELLFGGPAVDSRARFLETAPADRAKLLENFLGGSLGSFRLAKASVGNLENFDQAFVVNYQLEADGYARAVGDLLIVRPRVLGEKGSSLLAGKERKYPFEFRQASVQIDDFRISIPDGYVVDELPKPVDTNCGIGEYRSGVEVEGNVLHYRRTYRINDLTVPPEKLDTLRGFFAQIAADEKSSAVLRRKAE
jgi:transglutaminase-like putative cysteine protease